MYRKECVAMILAGGRGERLGALTNYYSKPAVYFGGSHRIIDFTLSNCKHSGINTIGVLSQYFAADLHSYVDRVYPASSDHRECGLYMRPSHMHKNLYSGTANAVYQNIEFIDSFNPEHVLILAGDHIYKMDYGKMIDFHKRMRADVTIASTPVPLREASRFGILCAAENGLVYGFQEKPQKPRSNLASMGIYVFRWETLKHYLFKDAMDEHSQHDFGKNIIPGMLSDGAWMYTNEFYGYWKDVGTIDSLWQANMDLLEEPPAFKLEEADWDIMAAFDGDMPCYTLHHSEISRSLISGGCSINGRVDHSVLGQSVTVMEGAEVVDSVIMPNVYIGENVKIHGAIIGADAKIMRDVEIGVDHGTDFFYDGDICVDGISLVAPWVHIPAGMRFQKNAHITKERIREMRTQFVANSYGFPIQPSPRRMSADRLARSVLDAEAVIGK